MKKVFALFLTLALLLSVAVSFAEGEVVMGQVDFAAHGDRGFAVITVALQDDTILAAKIDEFQFMGDREDLKVVGVPTAMLPLDRTIRKDRYWAPSVQTVTCTA